MSLMDTILERTNLSYEDLTSAEKNTLYGWLEQVKKKSYSLEDVRTHVNAMKNSVERELTTTENNTKQDIFLKARLRNYMLLQDFLSSPERAEKAIENALSGIAPKG